MVISKNVSFGGVSMSKLWVLPLEYRNIHLIPYIKYITTIQAALHMVFDRAEYYRNYFKNNPDRLEKKRQTHRKWREKNREHVREGNRLWRKEHPERTRELNKREQQKLKTEVLEHYSGGTIACYCCGENEMSMLTIDHENRDGKEHRKKINSKGGNSTYRWLRKNNYPKGFRVLCYNCNIAREFNNGVCPHVK